MLPRPWTCLQIIRMNRQIGTPSHQPLNSVYSYPASLPIMAPRSEPRTLSGALAWTHAKAVLMGEFFPTNHG